MKKLQGRELTYKYAIAKKVNEIIEYLQEKGILPKEENNKPYEAQK